ncbi:MAG: single-stranded-DNA-specific exonuclease RecJ [Geminicoccus sp.]|nr:single-stranded-DNA-specific exonuclease RecJ [Geminicoccus sp.]
MSSSGFRAVDAFLGVTQSVTGNRWVARKASDDVATQIAALTGLPAPVARALASRQVQPDGVQRFLEPKLRDILPDPSHLLDMDTAIERTLAALLTDETIILFADFDVDGATSSAQVRRFFRALGKEVGCYIPDRHKEGYGPKVESMRQLAQDGADLIITLDCGTMAHEALSAARDAGADVIVLDHHMAIEELPPAVAVVNPNRLDDPSEHGAIAACGLTFLYLVALNRALREMNYYEDQGITPPDLMGMLDMVAMGTVCDVVPLLGLNRVYVSQGLRILERWNNPGMKALREITGRNGILTPEIFGFDLGPRINAGSRMGDSRIGSDLLSTDDPELAKELAQRLDDLNVERRAVEAEVMKEARKAALENRAVVPPILIAGGEGWHPGVIGVVAGRLKGNHRRPAIVVSFEGGLGKGSGRSIPGINLGALILEAKDRGLLIEGGGHAMAAGLAVSEEKWPAFVAYMEAEVGARLNQAPDPDVMEFDVAMAPAAVTFETVQIFKDMEPFGQGNPRPRVAITRPRIANATIVGEKHVAVQLEGSDGARVRAIAFRAVENPLGDALLHRSDRPLHVAGNLALDEYRGGRNVQMIIEDAAEVPD